jgi:hypothetical protein
LDTWHYQSSCRKANKILRRTFCVSNLCSYCRRTFWLPACASYYVEYIFVEWDIRRETNVISLWVANEFHFWLNRNLFFQLSLYTFAIKIKSWAFNF